MKISLGKIFGIAVDIDYTWLLILGLVAYSATMGYFHRLYPALPHLEHWGLGVVAALLFFATLLGHELAHSVVARRRGIGIEGITLFIFGGVSRMKGEPQSAGDEFKMAIAGPLFSFGSALVFWLIAGATRGTAVAGVSYYVAVLNLAVGIFNLLPGFPLDGGRVLRAIIWKSTGNLLRSTRIASGVGQAIGWVFMGLGFFQFLAGAGMHGLWMVFIGWFLAGAAKSAYQEAVVQQTFSGLRVSDVMINPPPSLSAAESLDKAVKTVASVSDSDAFPVVEDFRLVGMLRLSDAYAVPQEKWPDTAVRDVARPVDASSLPKPDDAALTSLPAISEEEEMVLVVEDGKPVGVVTRNSLMRVAQFRRMAA